MPDEKPGYRVWVYKEGSDEGREYYLSASRLRWQKLLAGTVAVLMGAVLFLALLNLMIPKQAGLMGPAAVDPQPGSPDSIWYSELDAQAERIDTLEAAILRDPAEAVRLVLLQERIENLERAQTWTNGLLLVVVAGLLGTALAVLSSRPKPEPISRRKR